MTFSKDPRPSGRGSFFSLAFLLLSLSAAAFAVPPLHQDFDPGGRTCELDRGAARNNALRSGVIRASAFPTPSQPHVLVIRADFSDRSMMLSQVETEAFFDRVQGYFHENSYGRFTPIFHVSTAVHRLGAMATYGADCGSNIACRSDELRDDAVAGEVAEGTDFSTFHHIMIYHAGSGQETTGVASDIWSVFLPNNFSAGGQPFSGVTLVPETESGNVDPLGVICHEYGHQLGLPDLYDTASVGGASTVGGWDIMDYPYNAASGGGPLGASPPHLGAWSKRFLGFVSASTMSASGIVSLGVAGVTSSAALLPILISDIGEQEYFLVEYRLRSSTATYDKSVPGDGILIWHIDDSLASNPDRLQANDINSPTLNGRGRRGVDLIEADLTAIYRGTSRGEAGDAFVEGTHFVPPLSDAFSGLPSGLVASNFSMNASTAQFELSVPDFSTFTFASATSLSTTVLTADGTLGVEIPAGAFPDGTQVFLAPLPSSAYSPLGNSSLVSQLNGVNSGFILGAEGGRQPSRSIRVSLNFQNNATLSSLSSEERQKLSLARFISRSRGWIPLESSLSQVDTITTELNHLSLFQLMQASPGAGVGGVRIYPNPVRPSLGGSYSSMNFSLLPPGATVRLFTVTGELIRDVRANASGLAVWDARNNHGRDVASGIYLAVIERDGDRTVRKVAIER